jgi:hypothetical protein
MLEAKVLMDGDPYKSGGTGGHERGTKLGLRASRYGSEYRPSPKVIVDALGAVDPSLHLNP